jgi:hypothetical protein
VGSLREALAKAGPGDTIAIAEPRITEPSFRLDRQRHRDLTIESAADGKPVVIEADRPMPVMLDATNVEGIRIRNVEFDGKGIAQVGIQLSGTIPGTTVEGVTVRGIQKSGFKLSNAAGDVGRPILFDHCRAVLNDSAQIGFHFFAANADTRRATLRNSRVEGTGNGTGVRIDGALTDGEIAANRLFSLDTGVSFGKPPFERLMKGQITSNTVFEARTGIQFDLSPPGKGELAAGKYDVSISQNYFAKTKDVGKGLKGNGPVAGVTDTENAQGPDSGAGNLGFRLTPLLSPQLETPDPNNNATFLRFPGGPPEIGPKKVRVGAP